MMMSMKMLMIISSLMN
jgi:hypothetical protein